MSKALIPPEALEGLMRKAFVDRAVEPGLFWDALLNSHLYVPVKAASPDEDPAMERDEIPMLLGLDADGKQVVWLFTSPEAMGDYTEEELAFEEIESTKILKSIRSSKHQIVLIGPDGLTLALHNELIRSLSDGKVPEIPAEDLRLMPKDTEVFVGKPEQDVSALEARLKILFEEIKNVVEACFIQVSYGGGPRLLLGLRLKEETREALRKVAEQVAKASEGVLEKGAEMDITFIDLSLKSAFDKWGKPFFKK
jgi:hypothetical protein